MLWHKIISYNNNNFTIKFKILRKNSSWWTIITTCMAEILTNKLNLILLFIKCNSNFNFKTWTNNYSKTTYNRIFKDQFHKLCPIYNNQISKYNKQSLTRFKNLKPKRTLHLINSKDRFLKLAKNRKQRRIRVNLQ